MTGIVNTTGVRSGIVDSRSVTNLTGVLPSDVTGGSGLTALASNPTVTLGDNATLGINTGWPAKHIRQTVYGNYYGSNSTGLTSLTYTKTQTGGGSYNWKGQITDVLASSHVIINMCFKMYVTRDTTDENSCGFQVNRDDPDDEGDAGFGTSGTAINSTGLEAYTIQFHDSGTHDTVAWGWMINFITVDTSPDTGTNTYYLAQAVANTASSLAVHSLNTFPFTCIMQELIV